MMQDEFLLHGATSSTGGCAVLVVLNGPIRLEIGADGTFNALGNSDRATAVIGRAIRLALINLMDVRPGRHRPLDARPSRQVQLLRRRGRGGHDLAAASRGARHAEGGVGRHRDGGGGAAPDHERVDDRPEEILETFAAEMRANHAALLDLWRQLRADHTPSSCASTCRRRAGASPTSPSSSTSARASVAREWADVGKGAVVRDRGDSVYTGAGLAGPSAGRGRGRAGRRLRRHHPAVARPQDPGRDRCRSARASIANRQAISNNQ